VTLLIAGTAFSDPAWEEQPLKEKPVAAQSEGEASEQGEAASDAETKALDSTATQWSFQLAYQMMPDYYDDTLSDGQTRSAGMDDYIQLRIVAPLPMKSMTLLPRLTLRHYENPQGQSGMGNTELFVLIIPKSLDWGSGRMGIGPLVTMPGNENVARKEWGYGFAAAVVNGSGRWFYGLLFTQSWRGIDPNALPPGKSDTNRIGKVFVMPKGSWNLYAEYQTSAVYKDWGGSAVKNSFRLNVTYTMPVGK
jgi:hypothetical protein